MSVANVFLNLFFNYSIYLVIVYISINLKFIHSIIFNFCLIVLNFRLMVDLNWNCLFVIIIIIIIIITIILNVATGSYVSVSDLSEVTNGRIQQLPNGTLFLSNVDDSDPREFLCFLKPGRLSTAAQRSSAVNLEVHGKLYKNSNCIY